MDRLRAAETQAAEAERLLYAITTNREPILRAQLDLTFEAIATSCVSCHKVYRDKAASKAAPRVP
jgi:cytochrome c556